MSTGGAVLRARVHDWLRALAPLFRGESRGVRWHSARVFERLKVFEVTLPDEIVRQSPLLFLEGELGSPLEEELKLLDEQRRSP